MKIPRVPPETVDRAILLAAMKDCTLASAELCVVYSRGGGSGGNDQSGKPDNPPLRD